MPYAEVNDIRMYYEEVGSGIPLVLLHGATGAIDFHASSWGGLIPGFAGRIGPSTSNIAVTAAP